MNKDPLFAEMEDCLLHDRLPSVRLNRFARQERFAEFPFSLLLRMRETGQSPTFHPEGSVWNHTMLVVDQEAAQKQKSSDGRVCMWAALLHDIGKPAVTRLRRGKVTAYDHDRAGADLAERFLSGFTGDTAFISRVVWLVRYHMQVLYVVKNLPFQDIPGMRARTGIPDVALLGYCDRLGRGGADEKVERRNVLLFLDKCMEKGESIWLKPE